MPCCSVITCRKRSQEYNLAKGVSYHRFPSIPHLREKWILATGKLNWSPARTSTICSKHFYESDFDMKNSANRYLKKGAIPKIDVVIVTSPSNAMPPKKSNLNNKRSREARRKRVERAYLTAEQIATRNAAQKIKTAEARVQESKEQRDERLRQSNIRKRAARERNIDTAREQERQRQRTSRLLRRVKDFQTASKSIDVQDTQQTEEEPEIAECHTATNFENETSPEQLEEIPEGKTIIARVYHYFKNEYDILKAFTGNHWEVNPLANYLQRTVEATGINERIVTRIVEDKKYSLEKEQVADQGNCDARVIEGNRNDERMDLETKSDRLKLDTLEATGSSVGTEPSDEKQLPFPAPIKLRVCGVMKTECKIEPPDDGPPTIEDDPLKTEDSVDEEHFDITITEVKAEPQDMDMLDIEQSINSFICEVRAPLVPVHVKAEPSSPAD